MKKVTIRGWKSGVSVAPVTLLRLLREGLGVDLVKAKGLLDAFAEAGEVVIVPVDDAAAAHFDRLAKREGLSVFVEEGHTVRS